MVLVRLGKGTVVKNTLDFLLLVGGIKGERLGHEPGARRDRHQYSLGESR